MENEDFEEKDNRNQRFKRISFKKRDNAKEQEARKEKMQKRLI